MGKITTVLYDYDGTLMDTNQIIIDSWQHTFMTLEGKKHPEEEIYATFGEPLRDSMEAMFPDQDPDKAVDIYREYQYGHYESQIKMCPNAIVMLTMIKAAGYKSALVTARLKYTTMKGLEKFGLEKFFDTIVTCDECEKSKPDPEPALTALRQLGAKPEEAVMLGDTINDIKCAKNAGVISVFAGWAKADSARNAEGADAPDHEIDDPMQMLGLVNSL